MVDFTPQEQYVRYMIEILPSELQQLHSTAQDTDKWYIQGAVSGSYRLLAILEYVLHKDISKFNFCIETSISYKKSRYLDSYSRNACLKTNTVYVEPILSILCTGNTTAARDFTQFVDDHYDYERKSNHIASCLYRILVALILDKNPEKLSEYLEKLKKGYSTKQYQKLYPYGLLLEAIWKKDEKLFHDNLQVIVDTHKKMLRTIFEDYEDQFLCIWGIAFCNLARMKGMKIDFDHPLIPRDLTQG